MSKLTKKFVAIATALTVSVMLVGPGVAQGATQAELEAMIADLTKQLAEASALLSQLQSGGTGTVVGCTITSFDRNLSQGMEGADVKCLQIILNSDAATKVAASGAGSPGSETTYFGPLTKAAVVKLQNKNAATILTPIGLTAGTGYVGPATRPVLNSMISTGGVVVPPTGGTPGENKVSLAADNPAATTIAKGGQNAIFAKINFCAAATANTVSKITLTRSGLAADADIASVKLYEGVTQIGSTQAINTSNHKAVFASINWTIPANSCKVLTVKATLSTAATAGDVPKFQITAASDIVSTVAFDGVFPISSNGMTIAGIGAGSIQVATTSPSGGSKIAGGIEQDVAGFKFTASSSEAVKIHSITLTSVGSIVAGDISNIKLWYNSVQVGSTVANLDSLNKAIFDLSASPLEITANNSKTLKVTVDVGSSTGINNRTISFEITDNTRVVAYGSNSGGQLVVFGGTDWGTTDTWPQGTSAVSIVLGSLTVENSTAYSPTDQEYARGTNQDLMVAFKFTAGANEGVRITQLKLKEVTTALNDSDVSNITLYDADTGKQLVDTAGNLVPAVGMIGGYVTFGSYTTGLDTTGLFDIAATKNKSILVKTDISAAAATATNLLGFKLDNPSIDVKADGLSSLNDIAAASITPTTDIPATAISHDIIQYGTLTAQANAGTPSAATYALGTSDYVFAKYDLISTGEDILVSQLNVYFATDTTAATTGWATDYAVAADVNNARLYDGDTLLASDNAISSGFFNFALNLTVPKNTTKTVTVKANIPTGSTAPALTAWIVGRGDIIAEGASSGQTIPAAGFASAPHGNVMTKGVPGLVVIAANTPIAQTYIVNSPKVLLASLSFTASTTEDVSVSKIRITAGATTSATVTSANDLFGGTIAGNAGTYLSNIAIYYGATQIGNTVSALTQDGTNNAYYADFTSLSFSIPKGTTKVVDVYAKILTASSTTSYFYAGIATTTGDVIGSGLSSGQTATVKIGAGTDGTVGKGMVLGASGYLVASNDINRPISAMQIEGNTGVSFGSWKFTSANEPILISKLLFEVRNSVFATGTSAGYAAISTTSMATGTAVNTFLYSLDGAATTTCAFATDSSSWGTTAGVATEIQTDCSLQVENASGIFTFSTSTAYSIQIMPAPLAANDKTDELQISLKHGGTETVGKVAGTNANLVPGKVCLYDGTTQLACTSIGADAGGWLIYNFPSGAEIEVPYPGSKVLTLKADISNYLEAAEGSTVQFAWGTTTADTGYYATYILGRGKNSGADLTVNKVYNALSATSLTAYASDLMYFYGTKPVVTLNSGSPSGAQSGGSNNTVFKFDVTNPNTGISANINAIRFTIHTYAGASSSIFGRTFKLYKSTDETTIIGTGVSSANTSNTAAVGWVAIYPDPASEIGSNSTVTYILKADTSAYDILPTTNTNLYFSIEDGDFYWDDSLAGNGNAKVLNLPVAGGVMQF